MQSFDDGLVFNVFWSAWDYALHVDVGNSFNIVVFVRDGVVVGVIMILLNLAFEGTMCRKEFLDLLAYPAQVFFLCEGSVFHSISEGVCERGGRGV